MEGGVVDKITQYGAELAMLLRREEAHRVELLTCGAHVALRKNSDPVPLRADHLDGGNTFRLNPIADTLTSGTIARIVECPDNCGISSGHVHTADGEIHPTSVH
jgi:hypothetical protein